MKILYASIITVIGAVNILTLNPITMNITIDEKELKIERTTIIRTLKWVLFLMSYKPLASVKHQIEMFINVTEGDDEELKKLDRF